MITEQTQSFRYNFIFLFQQVCRIQPDFGLEIELLDKFKSVVIDMATPKERALIACDIDSEGLKLNKHSFNQAYLISASKNLGDESSYRIFFRIHNTLNDMVDSGRLETKSKSSASIQTKSLRDKIKKLMLKESSRRDQQKSLEIRMNIPLRNIAS